MGCENLLSGRSLNHCLETIITDPLIRGWHSTSNDEFALPLLYM